jgi:hypothetical protein
VDQGYELFCLADPEFYDSAMLATVKDEPLRSWTGCRACRAAGGRRRWRRPRRVGRRVGAPAAGIAAGERSSIFPTPVWTRRMHRALRPTMKLSAQTLRVVMYVGS